MHWLKKLDKHGSNLLIDELVWHLEEGRVLTRIVRFKNAKKTGFEYHFEENHPRFLDVDKDSLDSSWDEAKTIISKFPQLAHLAFLDN